MKIKIYGKLTYVAIEDNRSIPQKHRVNENTAVGQNLIYLIN